MSAFPVLLLAAVVMAGAPQERRAASTAPAQGDVSPAMAESATSSDNDGDLSVSLDRIRHKLSDPPAIKVKTQGNVFRVEVLGRKPTIEDILGPDYLKGPVPVAGGGMTHQEFLDLVTPKDVQGYAAFSNKEAATVAATSFALKWALLKRFRSFRTQRPSASAKPRARKSRKRLRTWRKRASRRGYRQNKGKRERKGPSTFSRMFRSPQPCAARTSTTARVLPSSASTSLRSAHQCFCTLRRAA